MKKTDILGVILLGMLLGCMFGYGTANAQNVITCQTYQGVVFVWQGYTCPAGSYPK